MFCPLSYSLHYCALKIIEIDISMISTWQNVKRLLFHRTVSCKGSVQMHVTLFRFRHFFRCLQAERSTRRKLMCDCIVWFMSQQNPDKRFKLHMVCAAFFHPDISKWMNIFIKKHKLYWMSSCKDSTWFEFKNIYSLIQWRGVTLNRLPVVRDELSCVKTINRLCDSINY